MAKTRFAVIGCGHAALPVCAALADSAVAALSVVYDQDQALAADLAQRYGVTAAPTLDAALTSDAVDAVYIAAGRSPRHPGKHAVLIDGSGALVFDPHPSDAGILSLDSFDVVFKVMPKTTNPTSGLLEFLGRMRRALGVSP